MSAGNSNILYQKSEVSFSCCSSFNQPFPKSAISPILHVDINPQSKDKKISLKKYHADIARQSSNKTLIKHPPSIKAHSQNHQVFQNYNSGQRGFSPINQDHYLIEKTHSHRDFINLIPNPHQQFNKKVQEKLASNNVIMFENKILSKTTKIQRFLPTQSQELKKTKKSTQTKKIVNLSELKQSVCSRTQSLGQEEKLEQSLILHDYFNPNEAELTKIEKYLKEHSKW